MTAVWILLGITALFIVLFSVRISVDISFSADKGSSSEYAAELRYWFLRFKILPKEKAAVKAEDKKTGGEEKPKKKRSVQSPLRLLKEVYPDLKDGLFKILGYILTKAVTINELNISADFGFDDPSKTGMTTGAAYAAVYNIIGLLDKHMKLRKRTVSIDPDFDEEKMKIGVFASLYTNMWHILAIGGIFIKTAVKILFKSWRLGKIEQSGNGND